MKFAVTAIVIALIASMLIPFSSSPATDSPSNGRISASDETPVWEVYWRDWWDPHTAYLGINGYTTVGQPTYGNVSVNKTWDDKVALKHEKLTTGDALYSYYVFSPAITNDMRIEFYLAKAILTTELWLYLASVSNFLYVGILANGTMQITDGVTSWYDTDALSPHEVNHWYHFNVSLVPSTKAFSVSVDGQSATTGTWAPAITSFAQVQWLQKNTKVGCAYIENVSYWIKYTHTFQSDGLWQYGKNALDWVLDERYNSGATSMTYPNVPILHETTNNPLPRRAVSATIEAAMDAYMVTGEASYYTACVDLARWLVEVCQDEEGYFPYIAGDYLDNQLTSSSVAGTLLRLYQMTGNYSYATSAIAAYDYIITNLWNVTVDLFDDGTDAGQQRINMNAATANSLALAYHILGNATYLEKAQATLTSIGTYMINYSSALINIGRYPYKAGDPSAQQNNYEAWTAMNMFAAYYYLDLEGEAPTELDNHMKKEFQALQQVVIQYGGLDNAAALEIHCYGYLISAYMLYSLIGNVTDANSIEETFTVVDYLVNRATNLQNANGSLPHFPKSNSTVIISENTQFLCNMGYWRLWGDQYRVEIPDRYEITGLRSVGEDPNPDPIINAINGTTGAVTYNRFVHPDSLLWQASVTVNIGNASIVVDTFEPTAGQNGELYTTWTVNTTDDDTVVEYTFDVDTAMAYQIYQDGEYIGYGEGPTFTFSAVGNGTFEIYLWYPATVSRLVVLTVNMLAMGLLVGVIGATIQPLREPKNRTPDKMTKVFINAAVCIIIGIVLITLVNNMFLGG